MSSSSSSSHHHHHHPGSHPNAPQNQPHNYTSEQGAADAADLHKALTSGLFTDDKGVLSILCARTSAQVQDIRTAFLNTLSIDMMEEVKKNTHGHFEDLVKGLVFTPAEYDAYRIKRAMEGLSTDDDQLVEILSHREIWEVKAYNEAFQAMFGKSAHEAIRADVKGDLGELYSLLSDPSNERVDPENADAQLEVDVHQLYEASQNKMVGHDNAPFIRVFGKTSKAYLKRVYDIYANKHGKTLENIITGWTFHTAMERSLLALITPPHEFYSNLLFKAMKGVTTNDNQLIRIIVTQRERYLPKIAEHFMHERKKVLKEFIREETRGDFKAALIKLLEFYAEIKD